MKVEIRLNSSKNGIELRFSEKPAESTTEQLKLMGLKYSYRQNMWYATQTKRILDFANELKTDLEAGKETTTVNLSPSFSPSSENIDQKNFTYVTITLKDEKGELVWEDYIVFEPSRKSAMQMATDFAKTKYGEAFQSLKVYPRNYLRMARKLLKEGKVIGGKRGDVIETSEMSFDKAGEKREREPSKITTEKNLAKPLIQSQRFLTAEEKEKILFEFWLFAQKRQDEFGNLTSEDIPLLFAGWLRFKYADLSDRKGEIWERYYRKPNTLHNASFKAYVSPGDYPIFYNTFLRENNAIASKENENNDQKQLGITSFESWLRETYPQLKEEDKVAINKGFDSWRSEPIKEIIHKPKKKPQPYSAIYKKLEKLIPDLKGVLSAGNSSGRSVIKESGLMDLSYDLLGGDKKGGYRIALGHHFKQNGELIPDPDMEIRVDPTTKIAEALHFQDQFGYRPVYVSKDGKELVNTREKKEQNKFLSGWLSRLLEQGHRIVIDPKESKGEENEEEVVEKAKSMLKAKRIPLKDKQKEKELLKDREEKITIPFTKQTSYSGSITLREIPEKGFSYGNAAGKEFGDFSGVSSPSIPVSAEDIYPSKEKALTAAFKEHVNTLASYIQTKDSIYNNEAQKQRKLRKALDELTSFALKNGVVIEKIPDKPVKETSKSGSIGFILPAAWRLADEEYPQNKIYLFGNPYEQSRLRMILLDRIEKTPLTVQLDLVAGLGDRYKERRPFSLEKGDLMSGNKSAEKKYKKTIRYYIDDLILDNVILDRNNRAVGLLEYLVRYVIDNGAASIDGEIVTKSKSQKKPNQYELNLDIEAMIVEKDAAEEPYSDEEKAFIARYAGSGGLIKQGAKGKGVLYEYFTPDAIVQKMWGLAYKFGYTDGPVLEPACGIGHFFKYAPKSAEVVGYEINPYSVRITEILYPFVQVNQQPFETIFFAGNTHLKDDFGGAKYKLVIGNPPYGEFSGKWAGMGEKKWTGAKEYDQYFITRGLDLLLPGGILIFIIPSAFLSNRSYQKIKEKIAQKAKLVDAYRLPSGVFKTTDIGTDIVVFKKF